jgi:hypothetical protein
VVSHGKRKHTRKKWERKSEILLHQDLTKATIEGIIIPLRNLPSVAFFHGSALLRKSS